MCTVSHTIVVLVMYNVMYYSVFSLFVDIRSCRCTVVYIHVYISYSSSHCVFNCKIRFAWVELPMVMISDSKIKDMPNLINLFVYIYILSYIICI